MTHNLAQRIIDNRMGKGGKLKHYLTVSRVRFEPNPKTQKYEKMTVENTVPTQSLSLAGIKEACQEFWNTTVEVDVLAAIGGRVIIDEKQPFDPKKPFFCRFLLKGDAIERYQKYPTSRHQSSTSRPQSSTSRHYSSTSRHPSSTSRHPSSRHHSSSKSSLRSSAPVSNPPSAAAVSVRSSKRKHEDSATSVPARFNPSKYLEMGRDIEPDTDLKELTLREFKVGEGKYGQPFKVTFLVEKEAFGAGGFRQAFKAEQVGKSLGANRYFVLKAFLSDAVKYIVERLKESVYSVTKKSVQMHMLVRNTAKLLEAAAPPEYGSHIKYDKVYLAQCGEEVFFIEPFIEGHFTKYVNNTGVVFRNPSEKLKENVEYCAAYEEIFLKACALAHFSFVNSKGKVMVLDIQGAGFTMTDPELASMQLTHTSEDGTRENLFGGGNQGQKGINKFLEVHTCNKYCLLLGLDTYQRAGSS
jgi:hypothetical protein